MGFIGFLFLLILFFLLWPVVRVLLTVRRAQNNARRAYSEFARQAEAQQRASRPGGWSAPRRQSRQGKKYGSTDGEYVEWEEISSTESTAESAYSSTTGADGRTQRAERRSEQRTESQIVDVEWEDLP